MKTAYVTSERREGMLRASSHFILLFPSMYDNGQQKTDPDSVVIKELACTSNHSSVISFMLSYQPDILDLV